MLQPVPSGPTFSLGWLWSRPMIRKTVKHPKSPTVGGGLPASYDSSFPRNLCPPKVPAKARLRKLFGLGAPESPCIVPEMAIWGFPKIGVPTNHPFQWDFSIINHQFWVMEIPIWFFWEMVLIVGRKWQGTSGDTVSYEQTHMMDA